ncbi:MAG TPA: BTAD domain-containing putative transcriptional regulator [Mycobacteriales bacterium]|nr:BTAD domain-containing putative transcriptional regulator [Mycobacteriales bacterium]
MTDSVPYPSSSEHAHEGPPRAAGKDGGAPWVIRRKIVPPTLPGTVVARPRLEALLTGLLDQHRVIFVYASAGAGKTTAIVQTIQRVQRPLAWLDVGATDVATGRLLVYLEAALAPHVPDLDGVASSALAARLPHAEVAGLLAESVGERPLVIVLDDAERLAAAPDALEVVSAFARYLPPTARLIIASRTELPFHSVVGSFPWVAAVGEEDLALTVDEAERALAAAGREDIDPVDALVETGGWMTGVLFEAWRAADHVIGLGGEADPLHGYLATEILGQLDPADADFLVRTSVLEEVSPAAAEMLGIPDAAGRLHSLSGHRLPVSWQHNPPVMRCHPRFREFLVRRLTRLPEPTQREIHRAHARLLLGEHHDEEAVEQLLAAGCPDDALRILEPVLERVIERTDFTLAESWLAAMRPARSQQDSSLAASELMLAVVRENFSAGVALADRLHAAGLRTELARTNGRAAGLMAWCYLHAGRVDDIDDVLSHAPLGTDADAARYAMSIVRDNADPAQSPPQFAGGPMDALVLRAHYDLGRLPLIESAPRSPWAAKATESWLVSALLTSGNLERAFELYHRLAAAPDHSVWLTGLLGPRLMFELAERDEAWRLLREGRSRIRATGSVLFEAYSLLIEIEFELRAHGPSDSAFALLDHLARHPVGGAYAFLVEQRQMLLGRAHLMRGDSERAVASLRQAVEGMQRGRRLLYLPTAAVYLAEAEWRCEREHEADAAAALAVRIAAEQGSNHYLLAALGDFPDVAARGIDGAHSAESEWHELGRALLLRGIELPDVLGGSVEVVEFGRIAVTVGGTEANPGLSKSVELLTFMANHERRDLSREALLDALFDGKRDASTAAYLRQAVLRLRKSIPDLFDKSAPSGVLRLNPSMRVATESRRLVGLLGEAAAMRGEERFARLLEALHLADAGTYLPSITSAWADERRRRLEELIRSARLEAAEVAFALGKYAPAGQLAEQVVKVDPYRESGWRLVMRLALLLGDHDRAVSAYRACEQALAEIGAVPSENTKALVRGTRR